MLPGREEDLLALGQVELDFAVAKASAIFLAKELSRENGIREVEVIRPLLGTEVHPGDRLRLSLREMEDRIDSEPVKGAARRDFFSLNICCVTTRGSSKAMRFFAGLPATRKAVLTAIQRRDSHPVEEVEDEEKVHPCEVLFRGPLSHAVAMLGSDNRRINLLGEGRLLYEQQQDRTFLPRLIAADLSRRGKTISRSFSSLAPPHRTPR